MVNITLPDGSVRSFDAPVTGLELAGSIGEGLKKAAVAITLDGTQKDITTTITKDSEVSIITNSTDEGLEIMRHTVTAQVLARALKNLYPSAKLAIGPTIDSGFYYDISTEEKITTEDLDKIEAEMRKIVGEGLDITRKEYTRDEAIKLFESRNEPFKIEIINDTPESETHFGIYEQGDGVFYDLCRGPHLTSIKKVGAFKLLSVAGAYWRGDAKNEMLTRIYGTAFKTEKELKAYLRMMEEAEKRDHRKVGPALDLFHFQEEAQGQVFWHDKGWKLFLTLQDYIRNKLAAHNYQEVNTPQLVDHSLYIKSGHWEKFSHGEIFEVKESETKLSALKPMNCPCHVQIFNTGLKSYRDLPLRMAEFGCCMRNESSGSLNGLLRVRSMTQDDAHIFCTPQQIESEVVLLCELIKDIYGDFGFNDIVVKFSDRPEMRVGSDDVWDAAEQALKDACDAAGLTWTLNPGEGAFYGPKLEFVLKDCIGRDWQCGTIQMDFNMPGRLGATYINEQGEKEHPVMIHRALLGSLERFTGILIENFAGHFPLWLAPVQIGFSGVIEKHNEHAYKLAKQFEEAGFSTFVDPRNEKINYKIREMAHQKIPYMAIIGDREIEEGTVTIRRLGEGNKTTTYKVEELIAKMQEEVVTKALPPMAE